MTYAKALKKEIAKANANARKEAYVQPLRPRSTVFKSKKDYNRAESKRALRNAY